MFAVEFVLKNFGVSDLTGKTPLAKLLNDDMQLLVAEAEALKQKIDSFRQSANGQAMHI